MGEAGTKPSVERAAIVVERPSPHVALIRIAATPLGVLRVAVKRALGEVIAGLAEDRSVRVVVLTGTGKAFSVGSDIREFRRDAGWLLEAEREENALNDLIEGARFPVIAAINGHALGGGLVLALACDMRFAATSARLGVPEAKVGAFASGSGTQRLAQLVGRGKAMWLLASGRIVDAGDALRLGLVEEVLPDGELLSGTLAFAAELASLPGNALEAAKACVNRGLRHGWSAGMAEEQRWVVDVGLSDTAAEGQRAFSEKRAPRFGDPD
jgi:enoyl-CoA hydratase